MSAICAMLGHRERVMTAQHPALEVRRVTCLRCGSLVRLEKRTGKGVGLPPLDPYHDPAYMDTASFTTLDRNDTTNTIVLNGDRIN